VNFDAAVLALVARIPRGRVATYGQLAALVGKPRSARAVGRVMSRADGVPWHRVVNSQGGISRRSRMTGMVTQRIRLEQEGVLFRRGRVVLSRFRWNGGESGSHETGRDGDDRDDARRPLGRRFRLGLGVSGPQVVASFWANGASGVTMLTVAGDRPAAHTTAELGS